MLLRSGYRRDKIEVYLYLESLYISNRREKIERYYYMMELISIYIIHLLWKLVLIFQNRHHLS